MNTRKLLFGLFACTTLIIASCTTDNSDIYESGVDKRHITKGTDGVDKRHITKGTDAVDKRHITKGPKKNKNN